MKKFLIILATTICSVFCLHAQEIAVPEGYELVDTIIFRQTAAVDTTLDGKNIFSSLPAKRDGKAGVSIHQAQSTVNGMTRHLKNNRDKNIPGYRVRIFFDNKQNSRGASEEAMSRFERNHPGIPAYRSFVSPFFKVTVGDFRTKSEAMLLLNDISGEFPSAFVVRENINYPVVDKKNSYYADTVQVLRAIK